MIFHAEAEVIAVVDGDTIHTWLDIGWGIKLHPRMGPRPGPGTIRLLHSDARKWDAPERKDYDRWLAAKTALAGLLPVGSVHPVVSWRLDDFGRTLGSILLPDGRDVADVMDGLGHRK